MRAYFLTQRRGVAGAVVLVLAAHMFLSSSAFAAGPVVYFDAPSKTASVGEELAIGVFLDTDQPVNAYAVNFSYPSAQFELLSFDDSRSIIDVWPRAPLVHESGRVELKGGSLQSFKGERGELITVRLKAREPGSAELAFLEVALYLANGKGTKVIPMTRNFSFIVEDSIAAPSAQAVVPPDAPADIVPPETLVITLTEDPVNPDQKLLSFQAKDADSGIQRISYETRAWFFWRGEGGVPHNPVALSSDAWSARVTAYDNAGNVTSRTVYDWGAFARGPLVVYVILLAIIARFSYKTWLRKKTIMK